MDNGEHFNENMVKVIGENLRELSGEYLEIAIDSILNGAAKDIPVIRTIASCWNAGLAFRDARLIKKNNKICL